VPIIQADSAERLPHIRDLFTEYADYLRDSHAEICFEDFRQELATLPGAYGPPDGRLLLAVDRTDIAGCVALRKIGAGVCEMKRLYVRPAFRGRQVGRQLAQAVIDEARLIGYRCMRLDTLPAMAAALALYRSLGFVPIAPYGVHPIPGAVYLELTLS
jgi:ribosomal protein S18 acetylase RimI-like enzyme